MPTKLRFALGLLLLATLIIGGSFVYTQVSKKPASPAATSPSQKPVELPSGLKAAQTMFTDYPQFIKKAFIQQQIEGTLKTVTENSWILEAKGKTLTLVSQGANKIRYTKLPKTATGSSTQAIILTEIKPEEMKVGDLVSINQIIDWQTGKVTITGITVIGKEIPNVR
ncbi:MAG: hypothetical protein Q7R82_00420 [Candidatus Daviesbacteria bacterium]|nr:hypothetical protein [Candidatus Daviesbacteria bacterium]